MFKTGAVMSIMLCEMAYNNLTLTIETWAPTALADRFALCANLPPSRRSLTRPACQSALALLAGLLLSRLDEIHMPPQLLSPPTRPPHT